jgi:flagellar operon protein
MKVKAYNHDVRLLEIARQGKSEPREVNDTKSSSFKETFSREMAVAKEVNFSRHAEQRLFSRGINMSEDKLLKISEAIDKAATKGSKDTLILDKDAAYVVSVPNRTVITAFSRANLQEGVFTSIDSAVIL